MQASAVAHANIALVKYWGKRDALLNLPAVGSISMTLKDLFTQTRVEFREKLTKDELILNGQPAEELATARVSRFLDIIRRKAGISRFATVESFNNFPTGAGLASSASGFAALALAGTAAANLDLSPRELSILARQGSGSAARSVFGGFVEMKKGESTDGSDAFAVQLYDENYWQLDMLILVTSEAPKAIGSTEGMTLTAKTSPYYSAWVQSSADDLEKMRQALAAKDFEQVGEISEFSCLKMHGLAISAQPGILYWNGVTVDLIHEVRRLRSQGTPAYVTIDAGPQVKVLTLPEYSGALVNRFISFPGVQSIIHTTVGPSARLADGNKRVSD